MSKHTNFFIFGTLWFLVLALIVRPYPDGLTLFISFAIGVYTTMACVMIHLDKQHGK